jgi:hypothetical protein
VSFDDGDEAVTPPMKDGLYEIPLGWLRLDGGTQSRARLDDSVAEDYAELLRAGSTFRDPLEAVYDGSSYWLWDGFHRHKGGEKAGVGTLKVNVRIGTLEDAKWLALGANKTHGLRRTNEDKRRIVEAALAMQPGMSDHAIAEHCGVSQPFVGSIRRSLITVISQPPTTTDQPLSYDDSEKPEEAPVTRTGRDGRTTNTSKIGKGGRKKKQQEQPTAEDVAAHEQEQHEIGEAMLETVHGKKDAKAKPAGDDGTGVIRDELGTALPPHLRDVFGDTKLAEEIDRINTWKRAIEQKASIRRVGGLVPYNRHLGLKQGEFRENIETAWAALDTAAHILRSCVPCAVCPRCKGADGGCGHCNSSGFVPRWLYDRLAEDAEMEAGQ